jgi:hypothetical protein
VIRILAASRLLAGLGGRKKSERDLCGGPKLLVDTALAIFTYLAIAALYPRIVGKQPTLEPNRLVIADQSILLLSWGAIPRNEAPEENNDQEDGKVRSKR